MSALLLKPEILLLIFEALRKPLPAPHAKLSDRSLIRQHDLARVLLVSKNWYNLASTVLYHTFVITDKFPQLIIVSPRLIPGITPKLKLLGQIRKLYIEYAHKEHMYGEEDLETEEAEWVTQELYTAQREFEDSDNYGGDYDDPEDSEIGWAMQLWREAKALQAALKEVTGWPKKRQTTVFERLEVLAVGAIYGHEEEQAQSWGYRTARWKAYGKIIKDTQAAFRQLVASTPTLVNFCQTPSSPTAPSESGSPLSLGDTSYLPVRNESRPTISFHTNAHHFTSAQPAVGVPWHWYNHEAQWEGRGGASFEWTIMEPISKAARDRKRSAVSIDAHIYRALPPWSQDFKAGTRDYSNCSVPNPTSEADKVAWRQQTQAVQAAIEGKVARLGASLPKKSKVEDTVQLKQLFDAPPCGACGWKWVDKV